MAWSRLILFTSRRRSALSSSETLADRCSAPSCGVVSSTTAAVVRSSGHTFNAWHRRSSTTSSALNPCGSSNQLREILVKLLILVWLVPTSSARSLSLRAAAQRHAFSPGTSTPGCSSYRPKYRSCIRHFLPNRLSLGIRLPPLLLVLPSTVP